jgi:signal transduction histidine kinase
MKKSLFTKLMSTYFIILIISYSLVAIFLSFWFNNYYYAQRENELIREGMNINGVNNIVYNYLTNKSDTSKLHAELATIDTLINARILIFDKYGYPKSYTGSKLDYDLKKQLKGTEIDDVLKGNIVTKVGSGNFMERITSTMLIVGVPVTSNDVIIGGVFLHSPIDEIKNSIKWVLFVVWMSAFFAILISAFIIYYFSERILIKPLGTINQTAKSISKGEFDKRVEVDSDDEIGDLAVSFNYMADSLQGLENMRKNFIANVSHELRSPMTSINGFISGIIDGTIPEEKWLHYLMIVHDEIKRLIRLINDILDLASLESGEFSLHVGVFDINELIRQRVIKFEDKINKKKLKMDVILVGNKIKVKGDRDRIDQVITNLLDNSIKFVPEEGVIEIKTEMKDELLLISVYNNGKSIPKEEIKYIWDRFHKADKARSKGGGTGLGLSIARQIVNQHKQTIWVESGDEGTKFTFTMNIS